jgi:hypothetical protein
LIRYKLRFRIKVRIRFKIIVRIRVEDTTWISLTSGGVPGSLMAIPMHTPIRAEMTMKKAKEKTICFHIGLESTGSSEAETSEPSEGERGRERERER